MSDEDLDKFSNTITGYLPTTETTKKTTKMSDSDKKDRKFTSLKDQLDCINYITEHKDEIVNLTSLTKATEHIRKNTGIDVAETKVREIFDILGIVVKRKVDVKRDPNHSHRIRSLETRVTDLEQQLKAMEKAVADIDDCRLYIYARLEALEALDGGEEGGA